MLAFVVGAALLTVCCSAGSERSGGSVPSMIAEDPTSTTAGARPPSTLAPDAFDAADAALRQRVSAAGLAGGVLRVVRGGVLVHDLSVGSVTATTPLSVASSTKWLTAATLMTFVDEGAVRLDDSIDRWLPEFAADAPSITVRQLLIHTSGVRDQDCLWSGGPLAECVRRLARSPRQFPAGSAYSYGNADFHVIGRLVEELAGTDFATAVRERITGPLGMEATVWPGAPTAAGPAAGVRTTVEDYMRFLAMIAGRGRFGDRQVLSGAAIAEIITDHLGGYDTSGDFAVGITRIPRYGLGCWPDVVDDTGATVVVSGNGGKGFYPWADLSTDSYGIVGVQDDRGAQVAVPASQRVAVAARAALA
ncbi:MAG: beta-lactamase family protein [Acidobacteria bacterium]|nr:beta-lactamase family protein [Acidobacteriota bacterium]